MSQGSIQTSLIRPRAEASITPSLEAPPRPFEYSVLAVGDFGGGLSALEQGLGRLGASVKTARGSVEALAMLDAGVFAALLLDAELTDEELDELSCPLHLNGQDDMQDHSLVRPQRPAPPILILVPDTGHADGAACAARALARLGHLQGGACIGYRSEPEALQGQLALLLEIYRGRVRAAGLAEQLDGAHRDLRATSETNAALAEEARRALTELETAQAQLVQAAKLAALGELVAGVAHEINNPLSFSLSHMATLRRGISRSLSALAGHAPETRADSARLEERLTGVTLGLDRIKSLVVKLQTFSRLDEGKSQLVDVAEAIGTVLTILHHRMRERIQLTTEFGKPSVIMCDPSLINQCVMNLVVNAIDAIDGLEVEGNIHISARAEAETYVIRVIDSGQGVPAEIRDKIFEPFFTTKPVGKGTGLGLSIAASVVRKHDGTLTLTPAPNGGTEAVIRIPLGRVAAPRRR